MDIRPQMGSETSAAESFQNVDLIFLKANKLVCEDSVAKCQGSSPACGEAKGAVSCVDMDPSLDCKWTCS